MIIYESLKGKVQNNGALVHKKKNQSNTGSIKDIL